MITKAEIMEKAALKIDLSTFPAEALEKMNEMFNGDYAGAMAKTDADVRLRRTDILTKYISVN